MFENSWYDVRREGSVSSWGTLGHGRGALGSLVHGSLASLKNVGGTVLAYAAGNRKAREPSGASSMTYYDEKGTYYEKDGKAAFITLPGLNIAASRPKGGRDGSYGSHWAYEDPFADYDAESFKMPVDEDDYDPDAVEIDGAPPLNDPPPKSHMYSRVAPASVDVTRLTPLSENPSFGTLSDPFTSSESSHASPLFVPLSTENSRTSYENSRGSQDTLPRSPRRPSSIIDANPPITANMRRSDSWWSRFTKTPLLERARTASESTAPRSKYDIDFRDPNPPPTRLVPIKESSQSQSPEDPPTAGKRGRDDPLYTSAHHGRSATSLQTARTADSAVIDAMGHTMDIIQNTVSSHASHASADSGSTSGFGHRPGPLSMRMPSDMGSSVEEPHGASPTDGLLFVQSPGALSPVTPPRRPSPVRRQTAGGTVAARVQAFEQQARSASATPPMSPQANRPQKARRSVYGLAPKPSLFVANPDRRTSSGSS